MSVDIGDHIEIRTMVPLLEVRLTDGSLVVATLPPTVGNTPQTDPPDSVTDPFNAVTDPPIPVTNPTTTTATTQPPTTASTEPPTTPGMQYMLSCISVTSDISSSMPSWIPS